MAIGFGRALATALSSGVKALGERAVEEEEKRDEMTKITLAQQLKNVEKAKEEAKKQQALIDAENFAVDALKGEQVTMKDGSKRTITPAMARQAVRRFGAESANKMILQGQIAFAAEKGGTVTAGGTRRSGALDTETVAALGEDEGAGIFGSRYSAVAKNTEAALRAMNIDPAGVDIPELSKVEGVEIFAGPALAETDTTALFTTIPGMESVQKVTKTMPTGEKTTTYKDIFGNDITEKFLGVDKSKVSDDRDTLYPDLEFGLAWKITSTGSVESLNEDVAFDKKTGERFLRDSEGKFTIPVKDKNIVTLTSYQLDALGGPQGVKERFDVLGEDGRKEYKEYNEQAESFEYLVKIFDEQLELLNKQENPDALVAPVGAVSEWIKFAQTNLGVGIEMVKDAAGALGIEFEGVDIARIENENAGFQQDLASETDPEKQLAIARKLYTSRQIIAAYYYAKSTGDTRISNQDFDQFLKTVSAGNADAQRAMYRARLEEAQTALSSKYTTFTGYLPPESSTDKSQQEIRNSILESIHPTRRPAAISTTVDKMFDSSVPVKTVSQIEEEISTVESKASKYRVQPIRIKDGKVDPDGDPVFAIIDEDGNPVMGTDGQLIVTDQPQVIAVKPETKGQEAKAREDFERTREQEAKAREDLERMIPRLIQSGVLR